MSTNLLKKIVFAPPPPPQSSRVDFIKLMLEANELGGKSLSSADLEMTVDDATSGSGAVEDVGSGGVAKETTASERIVKRMSMEVRLPRDFRFCGAAAMSDYAGVAGSCAANGLLN